MKKIGELISEMIRYYSGDVKRINHFIKVYAYAKSIGEGEKIEDNIQKVLEISAVVHDIGIKNSEIKYNSSAGKYQEIEGPVVAIELLEKLGYNKEIVDRVSYLVGHHHTYTDIDGIDYQILIEADFIVNILEDSVSINNIKTIRERIFRTETGKLFLDKMYIENSQ